MIHTLCLKVMRTFAASQRHIAHIHNGKQPKTARRGGEKVPYKRNVRPRGSSRAAKRAAAGEEEEKEEEADEGENSLVKMSNRLVEMREVRQQEPQKRMMASLAPSGSHKMRELGQRQKNFRYDCKWNSPCDCKPITLCCLQYFQQAVRRMVHCAGRRL